MSNHSQSSRDKPPRSRYGFVGFVFCSLLLAWMGLRGLLYLNFMPLDAVPAKLEWYLLAGLHQDAIVALLVVLPLVIWFLIVPEHWMVTRWQRALVWTAVFIGAWCVALTLVLEYQFFAEFQSRANTLVAEVAAQPSAEWGKVAKSYGLGWSLAGSALVALLWTGVAKRRYATMWLTIATPFHRVLWVLLPISLLAALVLGWRFSGLRLGHDRVLGEIASNGWVSLGRTLWLQSRLPAIGYATLPTEEAFTRVQKQLAATNVTFLADGRSLRRQVAGAASRPRLNVVLVIAESLETAFWGSLDGENQLTPELDKLVRTEALAFDQIYAAGNRTGPGLEGLLASFPPLPRLLGQGPQEIAPPDSIARVLKADGYATVFLTGGRSQLEDGRSELGDRSWATAAGFDRCLGEADMTGALFRTVWGVSDEDLFTHALIETRALAATGQPFLAVIQTVSNQRPFRYPTKPSPGVKPRHDRASAVRYADRALAGFLQATRQESYWTNTIFAIVANHGATVRGSTQLPVRSHVIPLVVLGPAVTREPLRVKSPGSALDVVPTLLGLIGRPYEAEFFGRDLRLDTARPRRAPLRHGLDLGVLAGEQLVVLKPEGAVYSYSGNPRRLNPMPPTPASELDAELVRDTIALFQVASERRRPRRRGRRGGWELGVGRST